MRRRTADGRRELKCPLLAACWTGGGGAFAPQIRCCRLCCACWVFCICCFCQQNISHSLFLLHENKDPGGALHFSYSFSASLHDGGSGNTRSQNEFNYRLHERFPDTDSGDIKYYFPHPFQTDSKKIRKRGESRIIRLLNCFDITLK